jgi:N-acetylmuramoyl-L-alanine amidase
MAAVPPSRPPSKHDILRAVYEDNLRVSGPAPAPRRRRRRHVVDERPAGEAPPPKSHRLVPVVAALALASALLAAALVGLWSEAPAGTTTTRIVTTGPATMGPSDALDMRPTQLAIERPSALDIADLFHLQVNTIVIDPGHGGRDPGALGANGLYEKDITLDVALRLRDRLAQHPGYRILLTRDTDEAVALNDRVRFANENDADLFVSLHVNSIPDASVTPLETYYFGLRADDETLRLAHGENAAADYSVAEFNTMLQRAGNTVKFQESKDLAASVQRSLVRNVRETNAEASDWGVKAGPFVVLLGVEAPAVLAEMAAISNPDEEARLGTEAHREALARSLEEGLIAYLQQRSLTPTPTATPHGEEDN